MIHTFGGSFPRSVTFPVAGSRILRVMNSEDNRVTMENGKLTVELKASFEAVAVHTGA